VGIGSDRTTTGGAAAQPVNMPITTTHSAPFIVSSVAFVHVTLVNRDR
jgi:hypothetical protein